MRGSRIVGTMRIALVPASVHYPPIVLSTPKCVPHVVLDLSSCRVPCLCLRGTNRTLYLNARFDTNTTTHPPACHALSCPARGKLRRIRQLQVAGAVASCNMRVLGLSTCHIASVRRCTLCHVYFLDYLFILNPSARSLLCEVLEFRWYNVPKQRVLRSYPR